MNPELLVAGLILGALVVYSLTGGADFGGGVWVLLSWGPRAERQRALVAKAIAPIWEANHVWLIAAITLLFTAFPRAFAEITTWLHVPLTLMLIGIVLRGSAFVFRSMTKDFEHRLWSAVFAASSALTPITLGLCVGAVAGGELSGGGFFRPWLRPFPAAVGLMTLALFAYLAAVYLIHETQESDLREDFRLRAVWSGLAAAALAGAAFRLSPLPLRPWPAALCGALALLALWRRSYGAARVLAVAQVALIVIGWGTAQYPYLVVPNLRIHEIAAPPSVLVPVLWTSLVAAALVTPAFAWLYAVFKIRP